jgi:hypothetical protein
MHDKETKNKFIQLKSDGLSLRKISDKINVSVPTLASWNAEFKKEISRLEYLKCQELIEKYEVAKCYRVEGLAKELQRINDSIDKKSYDDLSLKCLHDLRRNLKSELMGEVLGVRYPTDYDPGFNIEEAISTAVKLQLE